MRTHNIPSCYRKSKRSSLVLLTLINPHWLELPLSRTNFHGPKGVRVIEVRLYFTIKSRDIFAVCARFDCSVSQLYMIPPVFYSVGFLFRRYSDTSPGATHSYSMISFCSKHFSLNM